MRFTIAEPDHTCQFPAHADRECGTPATFYDLDVEGDGEIAFVCDRHLAPVMRSHEQLSIRGAIRAQRTLAETLED